MRSLHALVIIAVFGAGAAAAADCPEAVKAAALKGHAGATVASCEQEVENGKTQFDVKLTGKGGETLELDVTPDGKVVRTEEPVALTVLPPAVLRSLKAKHPDAKPMRAEKQTDAAGKVVFEISFEADGKTREATIAPDGKLVGEEADEGQD
jgi:uncharacterized membrane protein YkoI